MRTYKLLLIATGLFAVLLALPGVSHASYQDGLRAYVNKEYDRAIEIWTAEDLNKDAEALFALGVMYMRGVGVDQDQGKGVVYYRRAAQQNFASAQFNLGLAYYAGKGVAVDFMLARYWWQKAAELDHAVAQYNLGAILWSGKGITQDQARGMHWFRKAKENGNRDASNFLLTLFSPMYKELNADSLDLARNGGQRKIPLIDEFGLYKLGLQAMENEQFEQAFGYWQPLAADGHIDSQFQIARLLEYGTGVEKNFDQALGWYQKAAQKGQGDAQYRIGIYHMEESPEKNEALGFYWIQSAADNDSQEAKSYISKN